MTLKDKIREIIIAVYHIGESSSVDGWKVKDYATNRIMELIEEEKKEKQVPI